MKLLLENWREYLKEDIEVPDYLYHATYEPLIASIEKYGLGATKRQNWEDSRKGVVYLAKDPEVARSYAETNETVPEEWLDKIVVLKINTAGLDLNNLLPDQNVLDGDDTLEYHGVIKENINLDIEVGDILLGGRYKNKRIVVKEIGEDDLGQPTVNGKPVLKFRIEKNLPDEKKSKKTLEAEKNTGAGG